MKDYFKMVCAVYLFLIRDGKVLLLRRLDTGFEDGNYGVVSGHMDGGETIMDAMVREAKEESGIKIEGKNLKMVHIMHRKGKDYERVDFFFSCDRWSGQVKNNEPNRCDDLRWFSLDSLPENVIAYVKQALHNFQHGILFSEYGF